MPNTRKSRFLAALPVVFALLAALGCATTGPRPGSTIPPPPKTTTIGALLSHAGELDLAQDVLLSLDKADQKLTTAITPAMHELDDYVASKEENAENPPSAPSLSKGPQGISPGMPTGGGRHLGGQTPTTSSHRTNPQAREVAALTKRIEDAEMGAYLEVEKILSPAQRERAHEIVSVVWEELLSRDTAIRRRFGLDE